jgi:hypothetical protein
MVMNKSEKKKEIHWGFTQQLEDLDFADDICTIGGFSSSAQLHRVRYLEI